MKNMNMISQYRKLYLKLTYNKKLFSKISLDELDKFELEIYENKNDLEKINYEVDNILNHVKILDLKIGDEYILYKKIMTTINLELQREIIDYEKLRKLITMCQLLLDLDVGFYNTLTKINFSEVINDVEKNFVLEKRNY